MADGRSGAGGSEIEFHSEIHPGPITIVECKTSL